MNLNFQILQLYVALGNNVFPSENVCNSLIYLIKHVTTGWVISLLCCCTSLLPVMEAEVCSLETTNKYKA